MALLLSWAAPIGPAAEQFLFRLGQPRVGDSPPTCSPKDFLLPPAPPETVPLRRPLLYAEDKMEIIHGTIRETIPAIDGTTCGFVIDGGMEVRFSPEKAAQASSLISIGSRVEICGESYRGTSGDPRLDAQFLTNLDSNRFVNLETPPPLHHPEVSPSNCPTPVDAAPLAPPSNERVGDSDDSTQQDPAVVRLGKQAQHKPILSAKSPSQAPGKDSLVSRSRRSRANEDGAAKSIELAYDGVHRSQALLAYIKIVDLQAPDVSELFDEAMHTYQQAVSNYERQDYEVASEFATASGELSRCVEVVVSRILRSDSGYPRLVPYPLRQQPDVVRAAEAEDHLGRVEKLLSRIHWLVQNGTLPSEDRKQVQKIALWADEFHGKARQSLEAGAIAEASYFIDAAEAVAHSAEHVCKQDYIPHVSVAD